MENLSDLYYYIHMISIPYQITASILRYILIFIVLMVFARAIALSKKHVFNEEITELATLVWERRKKEYPLWEDNIIGASNRCDIIIKTKNVSRVHAQIYKKKNEWILCSYAHRPLMVNDITIESRIEISDGDIILLGEAELIFKINGQDEETEEIEETEKIDQIEEEQEEEE